MKVPESHGLSRKELDDIVSKLHALQVAIFKDIATTKTTLITQHAGELVTLQSAIELAGAWRFVAK